MKNNVTDRKMRSINRAKLDKISGHRPAKLFVGMIGLDIDGDVDIFHFSWQDI